MRTIRITGAGSTAATATATAASKTTALTRALAAFVAVATMFAVASCGKEDALDPQPQPQPAEPQETEVQTVRVKVNAGLEEDDETRSIFSGQDGSKIHSEWTTNKNAKFYVGNTTAVTSAPQQSGKYTSFDVTLSAATSGTLWVVSPSGYYNKDDASQCVGGFTSSKINATYNDIYVVIPETQTPLQGTCDESAHMVAASMEIPSTGIPSEIDMKFSLAIAYGKLVVKNFTSSQVAKAVLTFPNVVAGPSCYFMCASGITEAGNSTAKTITLLGENITKDADGNFVLYFGLLGSTHKSGEFKVEITDETGATYSKSTTLSEDKALTFTTGHVRPINVNMEGKGSGIGEGTVLWSETWTGGTANELPSAYGFEGTTTYASTSLTYAESASTTKLYGENVAGGTSPELFITDGSTWTVSNIPTGGAGTMTLTFKSNKTALDVASGTDGVFVTGSGTQWTIINSGKSSHISLSFKASDNIRIDDIQLVWTSAEGEEPDIAPSAKVTASSSGIGVYAADLKGTYSEVAGTVTEVGFEYGTSPDALTSTVIATKVSPFAYTVTHLQQTTTYYYRAYAKVKGAGAHASIVGTFYSNTFSFTTLNSSDVPSSHLIYANCMEFPAVSPVLSGSQYYSATGNENDGSSSNKWYRTLTTSSTQYIVSHTFQNDGARVRNYHMLFDSTKKCALWAAFALNNTTWKDADVGRKENWVYDPALNESWQANLSSSYTGDYDRGHQVASNDRQTDAAMNKQTFYFSNMSPQNHTLNAGQWETLEGKVQDAGWACTGLDTLYVVTGPIFDSGYSGTTDASGADCPIPTRYFKCVMKCTFNSAHEVTAATGVAYVTPGNKASSNTAYTNWITTIDYVEERTGFDFFTNVPRALQDAAESDKGMTL